MDIEKLTECLFSLEEVKREDEINLELFHHIFVNTKTKNLGDVRSILDDTSFEQLEALYSEIKWTESMDETGESYSTLGERTLFHIGENDNTYFNSYFWRRMKPIDKKKFI